MSDFRNDPNFARHEMHDYDSRVQWAAVAVILLLVGGLIVAAAFTTGDSQTAMNTPGRGNDRLGARLGSTATMPALPRQMRH